MTAISFSMLIAAALLIVGGVSGAALDNKDEERIYFPGDEGEKCRVNALEEWLSTGEGDRASLNPSYEDGVTKERLDNVMATELYKRAKDKCSAEIELYNRASGVVCLLESQASYDLNYTDFWMGGPYYLDGEFDLATMFQYTANFTQIAIEVGFCMADCYLGGEVGGETCEVNKVWMKNYGKISLEQYCNMEWGRIDMAFFSLKLCAAEAIGAPTSTSDEGMSKGEYVGKMQAQEVTYSICKYRYCDSDVYDYIKQGWDKAEEEGEDNESTTTASTDYAKVQLRH